MVTPGSFRQQFPAFANPEAYGDFAIGFWTKMAGKMLDPNRWTDPDILDYGTCLYVAHHLILAQRDALASAAGGVPGEIVGIKTAKAIDKVSASYDAQSVVEEGAGQYNATRYGAELYRLMRQFGAGGLQTGTGGAAIFVVPPGFLGD